MKGSNGDWKELKDIDRKLLEALELKQFVDVDRLIDEGANINVCFGPGDSALHYFVDVDIIEKLLKCGAEVNRSNQYRETPLMHAVSYYKHLGIVKLLLKYGANVWCTKRRGETAMSMALYSGKEKTIKELLEFGVYLKVTDFSHYTEPIFKLLIKLSLTNQNVNLPSHVIENSTAEFMKYADECQAELDSMNSVKLNDSLSLLSIVKNWRLWLPTQSIMKFLKDYEHQYPIYADLIFERICAAVSERKKLLLKIDTLVVTAKGCKHLGIALNMDCKRHVMKYVYNTDLEAFTNAATTTDDSEVDASKPNAKRIKIE